MNLSGIILAGGLGRRAGGADKGLLPFAHHTRVEAAIACLAPQVDDITLSANRNLERYRALGLPVTSDTLRDFQGPLAGILACLPQCRHRVAIIVPCDCPQLPADLAGKLAAELVNPAVQAAYAFDGEREQYLFAAIRTDTLDSLQQYLAGGDRSVRGWHQRINSIRVDFSGQTALFQNLNETR
jgi:molybdopterin-guanine dinucleotide biosynthesis protein A